MRPPLGVVETRGVRSIAPELLPLDGLFRAWDHPTTAAGTLIENFQVDSAKPTDGHEHAQPIYCASGIYYGVPNGQSAIIYFYRFPLTK